MTAQTQAWEPTLLSRAQEAWHSIALTTSYAIADQALLDRAYCELVTARHSRSFYMASSLLPTVKRQAVRALYAFCRLTDDIVDCPDCAAEKSLAEWRHIAVEYTLFSKAPLHRAEYDRALRVYLQETLGIADYSVVSTESGAIPIADGPFPRRIGGRSMTIGVKAGRLKPTTGFAFMRVQQHSAAIVRSLVKHDHPFDVPADSPRYHLYDSLLLEIMCQHAEQIKPILTLMFKRNPIDRIFRFLDEAGSLWENLQLIATLPPGLFLRALFRLKVLRSRPTLDTELSA